MHREDTYQRPGSHRGFAISIFCAMAIVALVLFSQNQTGRLFDGADNVFVGILLSAFCGAVSLFAYLLSRNSGRVQSSGFWQLIEGMSALVPPAVIAMCILPVSAEARPWILFAVLAVGCIGLVSLSNIEFADGRTHKFHRREYLFDRGLGQPFLSTIDVADPVTDLPHRRQRSRTRRGEVDHRDEYDERELRGSSGLRSTRNQGSGGNLAQSATPPTPTVDGTLKQQISRFTARNGDDKVEAIWSVHFDRDQKRTVVHVPFSPAFASRPTVECSLVEGDGVTLKVAEVHPYGVRIEARRSKTDVALDATIGFQASAKATARSRGPVTRPVVGSEFATSVAASVADAGRSVTGAVSQTASSLAQGVSQGATRVARRAVSGTDPVFSLGNPAETTQSGERISRTTGPHNPPTR